MTERVRYQLPESNLGLDLMRVDRQNRGGQGGSGSSGCRANSDSGSRIQRVQLTALVDGAANENHTAAAQISSAADREA